MKKSTLTLGVLVALGAVWTGGAWYTGKIAEQEFAHQIERVNKDLSQSFAALDLNIQLANVAFERGLFSSKTKYDIVLNDPESSDKPLTLPFEGTLYHGPLPLNQLSHFELTPKMFSAVDHVIKNDATAKWFEATKEKTPLTLTTTVGYNLNGYTQLTLQPFALEDENESFSMSEANLKLGFASQGIHKVNLDLNNAAYREAATKQAFQLRDIKIDADYERIPEWDLLASGKQQLSGGEIKIEGLDAKGQIGTIDVKNWKMDFDTVRKAQYLDSVAHVTLNDFTLNQINLGTLTLQTALNHIDGDTFNQLMRLYTKSANDQLQALSEADNALIKKLFEAQPQIIISPALTNGEGKIAMNLDMSVANADFAASLSAGKIFRLFNHFIFRIEANKAALIDTATASEQLSNHVEKEQAGKIATMKVNEGINSAVQQGILTDDGKGVKLDLVLEKGELKLNGKVIPEEQVASILFLAAMSMGR